MTMLFSALLLLPMTAAVIIRVVPVCLKGNEICTKPTECCEGLRCDNGLCSSNVESTNQTDVNLEIPIDVFRRAVSESWSGNPTDDQYNAFASSIKKARVSNRRELAMFLANIVHESNGLRDLEEWGPPYIVTDKDSAHPEQSYHGRGYLMLRGYGNYKAASLGLYGDERLVKNPDLVKNETVAWDTAFWFWANKVHGQMGVSDGDFGVSMGVLSEKRECEEMTSRQRFRIFTVVLQILIPDGAAVATSC